MNSTNLGSKTLRKKKKNPQSSKKQNLNLLNTGNYLQSIYTVLGVTGEKAVAPHSSTLAWKIPWTEGPGALQSMGSLGVGHDCATSLSLFTFMHGRRHMSTYITY